MYVYWVRRWEQKLKSRVYIYSTRTPSAALLVQRRGFPPFRAQGCQCCYRPLRRVVLCVLAARLGYSVSGVAAAVVAAARRCCSTEHPKTRPCCGSRHFESRRAASAPLLAGSGWWAAHVQPVMTGTFVVGADVDIAPFEAAFGTGVFRRSRLSSRRRGRGAAVLDGPWKIVVKPVASRSFNATVPANASTSKQAPSPE
jgi:hypothetical protein